jgi:IS30 family transposase
MHSHYQHLSQEEREKLAILKARGVSLREIAKSLGRSHTSLSRELHRNAPPIRSGYYLPHKAQARSAIRKSQAHQRLKLKNASIRRFVLRHLQRGLSPELVAGRLPRSLTGERISHESIYQFIYKEAPNLIQFLARAHRRRLKRWHTNKHRRSHIPQRVSITERPAVVETRRQFGHWEADTIVSRTGRAALMVMVERKSRLTKLAKLNRKTAAAMRTAINRRLSRYPTRLRRTLTYDNGSENTEHLKVNKTLGTKSFFCQPYHSWEKGTVENTAGLVRRTYPKRTNFDTITSREVKRLEILLNKRPRKCLGFRTPLEAIQKSGALTG